MITYLKVDGFKSLSNFEIKFQKGLNVLIGPNGAGKTNICQALSLISSASTNSISDYILSIGGLESTFTISKEYNTQIGKGLSILSKGEIVDKIDNKPYELKYEYSFSLLLKDKNLIINTENFKLYRLSPKNRYKLILETLLKNGFLIIKIRDVELIGPVASKELISKTRTLKIKIPDHYTESAIPILNSLFYFGHKVSNDLSYSKAWNIDPYIAKKTSDILEPSTMLFDGRRLANAVHEIFENDNKLSSDLTDLLKKVIPRFVKIIPETLSSGLTKSFSIIDENGLRIPIHSLSDGTIKLLALLIGIHTHGKSSTIIEEPENYLHPWASQTLIEYFRDYFENNICIITTHSETILNSILPKEIIVVTNVGGKTRINRLQNDKKLKEAIEMSGFGCGYHYVAGSLGGKPQ